MANPDSFLHLARPLGPAPTGTQPSTAPLHVIVQPQVTQIYSFPLHLTLLTLRQAIFSILDHTTRAPPDQPRVIGTLLGTRSSDDLAEPTITIHSSFAVGHTENTDQVEVDLEYQKAMLNLHLRANPKEVLVGWYATNAELNTWNALIQNFYQGTGSEN